MEERKNQKEIPELIAVPTKAFNINSIDNYINDGLAQLRKHYETEPVGEEFEKYVADMTKIFNGVSVNTVFLSIMSSVSKLITRENIIRTIWRLAGNLDKLKADIPVHEWLYQTELEWVPIFIYRVNKGKNYNNKTGFFVEYRVIAGSPAGLKFTTFFSMPYVRFLAKSLGYKSSRRYDFRLHDGKELTGMYLYILLDPKLSKENKPGFYHFYVPASYKKLNLEKIKFRRRIVKCPMDYSLSEMPCHLCPMGYDSCLGGCRPKTLYLKGCPRCNKESWFDPDGKGIICVECSENSYY